MSFHFRRTFDDFTGLTVNLADRERDRVHSYGARGTLYLLTPAEPESLVALARRLFGKSPRGRGKPPEMLLPSPPPEKLTLGFFEKLQADDAEEAFVEGCRLIVLEKDSEAYDNLLRSISHLDGQFLAGFLAIKFKEYAKGVHLLREVLADVYTLGRLFNDYRLVPQILLPVTREVCALALADRRGVLLGLVECYQQLDQWASARECLRDLIAMERGDLISALSLCEMLLDVEDASGDGAREVCALTQDLQNDTEVHAALLLYRARALRQLGHAKAARTLMNYVLRKAKDRSSEILYYLRYERALACQEMGDHRAAAGDWAVLRRTRPRGEELAELAGS